MKTRYRKHLNDYKNKHSDTSNFAKYLLNTSLYSNKTHYI